MTSSLWTIHLVLKKELFTADIYSLKTFKEKVSVKQMLRNPEQRLKGELQCKTTLGEVKDGQKIRVFPVLVFCVDPPLKENSL